MKMTIKAVAAGALLALQRRGCPCRRSVPHNTMRVGMYYVHYHSRADDISGPYVPNGLNFSVNDVETLYLAYVRRLSEHFDVEFAAGDPPLTKTEGRGPATLGSVPYNGQVISTASGSRRHCFSITSSWTSPMRGVRTSASASTTPISMIVDRLRPVTQSAVARPRFRCPCQWGPRHGGHELSPARPLESVSVLLDVRGQKQADRGHGRCNAHFGDQLSDRGHS